ncbi:MAG TPA: sigma-70 family RNA polymerase sigma factor [Bacillus sp. (in: firmicutes)]|uniref:sigma-70 family RNA polymerase sigma factor n=1 Tax=Bacillus litorisediminis TaxID=2922713 RepID=UPI001FAFEB60|nr:sigma-70 family RNA polymerase sigma factor [Bacillus litorisediminis]HWO75326.1 sigma-70 family RNA polymerase sigma factor [Bacillus sp. (in: firmicutes)]
MRDELKKADSKNSNHQLEETMAALYPKLQQYCHFLSQNQWDGDDLAQEVAAKVFDRYKYNSNISPALLRKMAYNHWIDTVRKKRYETLTELNELELMKKHESLETSIEVIEFLMKELTPKQAAMFLLKEGFHFQINEISEIFGSTEISVKSMLYRARKRIESKDMESDSDNESSALSYWHEDEQEQIYELFKTTIETQDPSILIKAIPFIRLFDSEANVPKLVMKKHWTLYSPSSTLSMAA